MNVGPFKVTDTMSRKKFITLFRFFNIANNQEMLLGRNDKLYKVRPLLSTLHSVINYIP